MCRGNTILLYSTVLLYVFACYCNSSYFFSRFQSGVTHVAVVVIVVREFVVAAALTRDESTGIARIGRRLV